jgi:hypothetical protein
MTQVDDLSRSLVAFDPNTSLIAVVEMSESSWLVAEIVPGIDRQSLKKLEPAPNRLVQLLARKTPNCRAGRSRTSARTSTRIASRRRLTESSGPAIGLAIAPASKKIWLSVLGRPPRNAGTTSCHQ